MTNPVISSPGTGVQHRASLTQTSPSWEPITVTPGSESERCFILVMPCGVTPSAASSAAAASPPAVATRRWITVWGLIRPSPIEAYRALTSCWRRSAATVARAVVDSSRWTDTPSLRMALSSWSLPLSIASSRRSRENQALILLRARGLRTNVSQSRLGPAPSALDVNTSTASPFDNGLSSGTSRPLTRAPTQRWPSSVCTA